MSSFQGAEWLRRLWSLGAPGDPVADYVANVQLVNDMRYRSSREHAPYGRILRSSAAPAATEHAGWELRADDTKGNPLVLLHHLRVFPAAGVCVFAVTTPTAALIADRTASTFTFRDTDPNITLTVNQLSTANADLPTAATLPPDLGVTAAWQGIFPFGAMPFAGMWRNGESLYVFAFSADQAVQIDAAIQGIRA